MALLPAFPNDINASSVLLSIQGSNKLMMNHVHSRFIIVGQSAWLRYFLPWAVVWIGLMLSSFCVAGAFHDLDIPEYSYHDQLNWPAACFTAKQSPVNISLSQIERLTFSHRTPRSHKDVGKHYLWEGEGLVQQFESSTRFTVTILHEHHLYMTPVVSLDSRNRNYLYGGPLAGGIYKVCREKCLH